MRTMEVWGMTHWHKDCPPAANGSRQTRTIVAATSRAAAARAIGVSSKDMANYGCTTGNAEEIKTAMAEPGVVFWQPLHAYNTEWTRT